MMGGFMLLNGIVMACLFSFYHQAAERPCRCQCEALGL